MLFDSMCKIVGFLSELVHSAEHQIYSTCNIKAIFISENQSFDWNSSLDKEREREGELLLFEAEDPSSRNWSLWAVSVRSVFGDLWANWKAIDLIGIPITCPCTDVFIFDDIQRKSLLTLKLEELVLSDIGLDWSSMSRRTIEFDAKWGWWGGVFKAVYE